MRCWYCSNKLEYEELMTELKEIQDDIQDASDKSEYKVENLVALLKPEEKAKKLRSVIYISAVTRLFRYSL